MFPPDAPIDWMNPLHWKGGPLGVFLLFAIPVGGGIPAGVLMGRGCGIGWPVMTALYFASDVVLAFVFEPILKLMIRAGRTVPRLTRVAAAMRLVMDKTLALYGGSGGPFALIMIAFGVDPMTGRAATVMAGHGFLSGWTLSITGDMLYFFVIMASTLWLNSFLGDGRWTMMAMLAAMIVVPILIQRWREKRALRSQPK
jgi:hypothetical protein